MGPNFSSSNGVKKVIRIIPNTHTSHSSVWEYNGTSADCYSPGWRRYGDWLEILKYLTTTPNESEIGATENGGSCLATEYWINAYGTSIGVEYIHVVEHGSDPERRDFLSPFEGDPNTDGRYY